MHEPAPVPIARFSGASWAYSAACSRRPRRRFTGQRSTDASKRGFTLVELLVVLGVVGALIAIVLPTLSLVMRRGRALGSLSNLRTHAQMMSAYATNNGDFLPVFLEPGDRVSLAAGGIVYENLMYFDMHQTWNIFMAEPYYRAEATGEVFSSPSVRDGFDPHPLYTVYHYACSFVARPEFWVPESRMLGDAQFGGNRMAEVLYPADKSLIVESRPFQSLIQTPGDQLGVSLPAAMTDGSAGALASSERAPGYPGGDGYTHWAQGAVHTTDFPPLLHTLGGVRGRDRVR